MEVSFPLYGLIKEENTMKLFNNQTGVILTVKQEEKEELIRLAQDHHIEVARSVIRSLKIAFQKCRWQ